MKTINELTKESMVIRTSDPVRSTVYRMLVADAKKVAKEEHREATEADLLATAQRQVKETENALELVTQGKGDTSSYIAELAILREFLPPALDDAAIESAVEQVLAALAPEERTKKSMGAIMAKLKEIQGMDMKRASRLLASKLT